MLAEILSFLGDMVDNEVGALCLITKKMCGAIEMYNRAASDTKSPVIISMDVKNMYPSLEHADVALTCRKEFMRSAMTIEEVDPVALGLYLAIKYQDRRAELDEMGLGNIVQKRRNPRARKILITTEEVLEPGERTVSKFHPPGQVASREQVKLMMGLALEQGILDVFQQHYYSWDGKVKVQGEGAPIGLKISGAVGKVAMLAWVRDFKTKMIEATSDLPDYKSYLHQLYVDDNNTIMEGFPLGTRMISGKFKVVEELVEEDKQKEADERTAELVMELANTICPYLQMEVDFPSRNPTGWMPILNLQVRMADDNTVDFKWYGKPMSSPFSILNRSAMPPSVKRITLVQMGVTMLRNTRPELHNELKVPMMEQLATKMMISGYPADFRRGVIESAVKCYEGQLAASVSGEKPLYRPRTWQQEVRKQKKMVGTMAWFRPADTVLRVPFTPNSELAKEARAVVEEEATRLGLKVKVVEGSGIPLKRQITTSDLGAGKPCPQGNCLFCTTGDGKGGLSHHRRGAVYSGECKLCHQRVDGSIEAKYWGESGDSGYCRTLEHGDAVEHRREDNAFYKHLAIHHPNEDITITHFKFTLLETHNQPLFRQTSESCYIHHAKVDIQMNSKAEWHQPTVGRVVITRDLPELQQHGDGRALRRGGQ